MLLSLVFVVVCFATLWSREVVQSRGRTTADEYQLTIRRYLTIPHNVTKKQYFPIDTLHPPLEIFSRTEPTSGPGSWPA